MDNTAYELVIGNKNWSSWSLRPWIAMTASEIPFREINVPLRRMESRSIILEYSPSGNVPVLKTPNFTIWDSLSIIEFIAEQHSEAHIWPQDIAARAMARSISAEMHSSFHLLRREMPMELLAIYPTPDISDGVKADIRRVVAIWKMARSTYEAQGPYLFGAFSAADAMFSPVATRFQTYNVKLADYGDDGAAAAYARTIIEHPAMQTWRDGARSEQGGNLPAGSAFA
ncbi:MAG: glutathione S-transferase family protein [Hyphomicrobiales bacterium]|nr:glutathione S-transferase family protein [Hyphomicrobiales bacterium]